ncbi:hypothetical protein Emag_000955 [Eimeria magna]
MRFIDSLMNKLGIKKSNAPHPTSTHPETAAAAARTEASPAATPTAAAAPAAAKTSAAPSAAARGGSTSAAPGAAAPGAAAAAPAAAAAAAAASTRGAYLTFDGASNGTLFIIWSHTPVDGAFAFFEPKKAVAEFKFKDNGGKSEIIRNLMEDKIKYYRGWCEFFKFGAENHGICKLLPGADQAPLKVEVAFLDGSRVLRLQEGASLPVKNMTAIGCVPKGDPAFQAQTLAKEVFVRNARKGGAAILL